MFVIRFILSGIILSLDWLFTPKSIVRSQQEQAEIDAQTASLVLYQFKACPFCVKVRRSIKRQGLKIETGDAKRSESAKAELLAGGGKVKVPCLRIEQADGQVEWMYESSDIISYLEQRFSDTLASDAVSS